MEEAANEQKVVGTGLLRAPAAVIHSALNLNLNLHRLIKHPAVQNGETCRECLPVEDFLSGKRLLDKEALKGISSCDVGSSGEVRPRGQSGFCLLSLLEASAERSSPPVCCFLKPL